MINFSLLDGNIFQIDKQRPLVLYGAGNIGKEVCKVLLKKGYTIKGFLDAKAEQIQYWENIPIFPLVEWRQRESLTAIITIHNRDVFMPAIIKKLYEIGFQHIFTMIDIFDVVRDELNDRFWLTNKEYYRVNSSNLEDGYFLWDDEKSRSLYKSIIEFRMSGNYELLPERDELQYFPKDIPRWREPIRMIDAGAYDGDTIRELLSTDYKVDSVVSFEPDMGNFQKLKEFANGGGIGFDVMMFPCGVWSETTKLEFQTGNGEATRINEGSNNGELVQCVAIDDVIHNFKSTLIKMDIEGAEIEALQGSKNEIEKHLPGLAICVYHHPDHIWKIPKLIKSFNDRYSLFLRLHAFNSFDLVLYALPK